MTAQPSLFEMRPEPLPVRRTDPATSRAAARRLPLRKRKRQVMEAISFLVYGAPGSFTADEVLDLVRIQEPRWERGWVASRLSQLAEDGLVERCGVAEGRMGADVSTFLLTDAGREWLLAERGAA